MGLLVITLTLFFSLNITCRHITAAVMQQDIRTSPDKGKVITANKMRLQIKDDYNIVEELSPRPQLSSPSSHLYPLYLVTREKQSPRSACDHDLYMIFKMELLHHNPS